MSVCGQATYAQCSVHCLCGAEIKRLHGISTTVTTILAESVYGPHVGRALVGEAAAQGLPVGRNAPPTAPSAS